MPGVKTWDEIKDNYRHYVGPGQLYDVMAANQFSLLTYIGLREHHTLLDIGCGSLRAGRLFIPYLLPGKYFGIDPNRWLIDEAIEHEIGADMIRIKKPSFDYNGDFNLSVFGCDFDFILAQSIFSHASKGQITKCLSEAAKVLKPKGVLVATFYEGEVDYDGEEWSYPLGVDYTPETMMRMATDNGLKLSKLNWEHPAGQTWIAFRND